MPRTVFKLGGSLLGLANLPQILRAAFALRAESTPLLVVGGGRAANLVREWDELHALGDESSHTLALAAMRFNAEFLRRILPGFKGIRPVFPEEARPDSCQNYTRYDTT